MDDETGPTTIGALSGKIQRADAAMKRSADLIAQEANAGGKIKPGGRERTRKILTNIEQVVGVLEGLAELHPIAKAVVKEFKAILRLELDRRENSEQIVAVCHSMTTMVYALRYIASRADEEEELHDQLNEAVGQLQPVMLDFARFCDLYYNRCKYRIVRFLRGTQFKGQLSSFAQQFNQHQQNIEFILTAQSVNRDIQTSENVANVLENTNAIIARMDAIQTAAEKAAAALVEARGGPEEVCVDADAVREVARKLGTAPGDDPEPVTSVTLELLSTSLDELLLKNQDRFDMKLESAKMEIAENVARMTGVILKKLDEGPHELIGNLDVKEMWKANGWRISVKARYFVDALYNHFSQKFGAAMLAGEDVTDEWTLKVFARIVNHPAVGEAVDEDASGFVSLHEVNHFVSRKPENLSTPVWFAFWAVGWRYLNVLYTEAIVAMLNEIEVLCERTKSGVDNDDLDGCVDAYLESCKLLRVQLSWLLLSDGGHDEILDDMDEEARGQLQSYAVEISELQEAVYDRQLNGIEYVLDDPALLPNIVGSSNVRIEQVFLGLIYVILRRQIVLITENTDTIVEANEYSIDRFVHLWGTMDATIWTLLVEYHQRTKSLMRSWRSQKEDVDIEVHCYAGGLLYGWYLTYQQPGNLIKQWMERVQDVPTVEESPADPIAVLQAKVSTMDGRISNIEKMLQQLLAVSTNGAAPHPSQVAAAGDMGAMSPAEDDESRRPEGDYDDGGYGGEQYGDE